VGGEDFLRKGFTARHPDVPEELRGTYAALTCPAVIDYLRALNITAIELMPVHQFVADRHLVERGLANYWGYNSIGFFAPEVSYSSSGVLGQQVAEFKTLVRTLHREGIEVILDVVYNHTGEGNHLGPTLCFRGIDNAAYYRLVADDRRYYMDYTGTGNTLNMTHPRTLQHESIELRIDPSYIAGKYYNYGNGLRLFDIVRQTWGNDVHVVFQSGSVWGSYEQAVNRLKPQCPNISFVGKYAFLQQPLHYFRLSLPR
jgi:Alpha amylase, catalytic domain